MCINTECRIDVLVQRNYILAAAESLLYGKQPYCDVRYACGDVDVLDASLFKSNI
jgi:hypothetical protein